MSLAPPTRELSTLPANREALHRAVERLLGAPDAASVAAICETLLSDWHVHARLGWRQIGASEPAAGLGRLELAEDPQSMRVLVLEPEAPLSEPLRERLGWFGRLAGTRLRQQAETARLYEAISRLALAERLQRALYSIAEQAGAERNMAEMMRSLHAIVGSLMYAENFYIVLYDAATDSVRFPYYADAADRDPPSPERTVPLAELERSLTWNLLKSRRAMMGSIEELTRAVPELVLIGPDCEHWLGVPMLREGKVVGGIVIQSYRADTQYTPQDRELLCYVAQHVQTALEKREAQAELERRVADRTAALREANRVLRQQVLQRQRGERLQAALFRIAELASTSEGLDTFYAAVHRVIGGLLYARNFYIALVDEDNGQLTFPYSVDEVDNVRTPRLHGRGATEYVLRHGKPLLANPQELERLTALGEIQRQGAHSLCWLGVPLVWGEKVMGVLAVQSYTPEHTYNERDQELLTFVSYHIANALQRKHTAESLKQAYAGLERRVTERTRALALANRDLREQIAERERVERRLKYETLHDSLTGLPNRTLLLQRMEQALERYRSNAEEGGFAVLFIDLDRFKVINDSVGHLVGDDLLFQVGGRIRACLKTRDVVARLGGDEFAVLLEGIVDADTAVTVAERVISELQTPFRLGAKEIFTSASIGVALPGLHYQKPEELLRDADAAMYRAKDEGRHRAALFDDRLRREALSLLEMESDLRRGLARNEFVPFYQPIVALEDGRVVGYEALMRWHHPDRGLLAPGEFLVIAEEAGCAESIDWQIFEQVCMRAPQLLGREAFVSINVSGRHFRLPDLDARLLALLAQYGLPPKQVRIEVTERALLDNPAQVKRMLGNLRSRGVTVALDDFGTGYSSLSYLHQYAFETLKIDRSFITELPREGESQGLAVVRAIQVLADSLHMLVIAEGIEEEHQRQALMRVGCRYGQGFLFARPKPIEAWLTADPTPAVA